MNNEPKTDLLLRMMEQPELYTDEQWCDILSDDECRQLYTLMALTKGATDAARADAALTDDEIEEEWEKVMKVNSERVKSERVNFRSSESNQARLNCRVVTKVHSFTFHFSLKKIAAVLLTAVFLGGLAWAFVPRFITPKANAPQSAEATTPRLDGEREGVLPVSFNDMRLDSILSVVATHYHHAVCFRDSSLRALHFYTTWDDSQPIDSFLTTLDEFEGLRLSRERDTIFVESETGEEAQ